MSDALVINGVRLEFGEGETVSFEKIVHLYNKRRSVGDAEAYINEDGEIDVRETNKNLTLEEEKEAGEEVD